MAENDIDISELSLLEMMAVFGFYSDKTFVYVVNGDGNIQIYTFCYPLIPHGDALEELNNMPECLYGLGGWSIFKSVEVYTVNVKDKKTTTEIITEYPDNKIRKGLLE